MKLANIKDFGFIHDAIAAHEKKHKEKPKLGLAIYTDGGGVTGPHPLASFGVHCALYFDTPTKQGLGGVPKYMLTQLGYAHTDAMDKTQEFVDPYGDTKSPLKDKHRIVTPVAFIEACGSIDLGTNNIGELTGLIRGLEICKILKAELPIERIHFRIDSRYAIQAFTRLDILRKNGWQKANGEPIKNKGLIQELDRVQNDLSMHLLNTDLTVQWVNGHAEYLGNIRADELASMGLVGARNLYFFEDSLIAPAKGFWNTKTAPEYFFADAKLYTRIDFLEQEDNRTLFIGTHTRDNRVSQRSGDFFQAAIRLNEVPEQIDALSRIANKFDPLDTGENIPGLYAGQTNVILDESHRRLVMCHDGALLKMNKGTKDIHTPDGKLLLARMPIDGTSEILVNRFRTLENILETVVSGDLPDHWVLNDITDKIYKRVTVGKKEELKLIHGTDTHFKTDVTIRRRLPTSDIVEKTIDITTTFGVGAPQRRTYGGVRSENPIIYILTVWQDPASPEYFTVVRLENGNIGVWGNDAGNRRGVIN